MKAVTRIERKRLARDRATAKANAELAELIAEAREDGEEWNAIAAAMGITRQGLALFVNREARARNGAKRRRQDPEPKRD